MAKLITESSFDLSLRESKDKILFIEGIFSSAESLNNNKRKYPKKILEREIDKVQEQISEGTLWGEMNHPSCAEINPERVAIQIKKLVWEGNNVIGRAEVLNTPMGEIAKELINKGKLGISSRGLGTVNENGEVNEDYSLLTYDLVTNPSNVGSWVNGILEGVEFSIPSINDEDEVRKKLEEIAKMSKERFLSLIK